MRTGIGVVVVMAALAGTAATGRGANDEAPCLEDIERFCAMVPDAGAFLQDCLRQRSAELSPECRKNLDTATEREEIVRGACRADADRFCADVGLSGGKQIACLLKHRDEVSQGCRDGLEEASPNRASPDPAPSDATPPAEAPPEQPSPD